MTATQVFILFLRKELSPREYIFFMHHLSRRRRGGKVKPMLGKGFVEDYLYRTHRTLGGFMTRVFTICPSLLIGGEDNPTYKRIYDRIILDYASKYTIPTEEDKYYLKRYANAECVCIYRSRWHDFLHKHIESEKKFNSPFKKGETYDLKLKE